MGRLLRFLISGSCKKTWHQ